MWIYPVTRSIRLAPFKALALPSFVDCLEALILKDVSFMAPVAAFHSARESDRNVYHNTSDCAEGRLIEQAYIRAGTAGLPICKCCSNADWESTRRQSVPLMASQEECDAWNREGSG